MKLDKNKCMVILKKKMEEFLEESENEREIYIGFETTNLMAESALNVLLAIEDHEKLLKDEGLLK